MKNPSFAATLVRGAATLAVITLFGLGVGCAGQPVHPEMTLKSLRDGHTFTQQFSNAYLSRDPDGDADVVVLDRAAEQAMAGIQGSAPVRQVMHLRVLWNPKRDQKTDHNSASNATVHWYVMGNTPESAADILEYAGTAFVIVDDLANDTELTIRNAAIQPVACRGGLQDPVGSSMFQGVIHATENRTRVREALRNVCTVVARAGDLPSHVASAKPQVPSVMVR